MIAIAIAATLAASFIFLTIVALLFGNDFLESIGVALGIMAVLALIVGLVCGVAWLWEVALA